MEGAAKFTLTVCAVFSVVVHSMFVDAQEDDSSCTQIDFDEATLTSLGMCGYTQEFIVKPYAESAVFDPYRPGAVHYLSNQWQGRTCGKTVQTYSFNADTELRMAYNLIFDSGATMEVRVYDQDRLDAVGKPILVESWRRMSSTDGWGYFRERLNKTVKRAQIEIEANMNAGSDLAIEYLTIFNYEVDSDECGAIDEFQTTTEAPSTTPDPTTTTLPATTIASTEAEEITDPTTVVSEQLPTTTPEAMTSEATTTASEVAPTATTTSTTITTTTPAATTPSTTTTAASSTTTSTTVTTTTNGPRDDTSMLPTSSTTVEQPSSTVQVIDSSSQGTPAVVPPTSTPTAVPAGAVSSSEWMWMTLAALFATLFFLAASAVAYLWFVNHHLDRVTLSFLQQLSTEKQSEKHCIL